MTIPTDSDNVGGLSNTTGTADFVMSGNMANHRPFTVLPDGAVRTYKAFATDLSDHFEVGVGTWDSGTNTFARTTVDSSTTGSTKHSFPAGGVSVVITLKGDDFTGLVGADGQDGNTVLYGGSNPGSSDGVDGNFFINTSTNTLFGPKASGAWPAGTSLVGPTGADGDDAPPQTGSQIKTLYEGESNTNAFTDSEKTKLSAVEAGATQDQTGAEIKALYEGESNTNAYTDAEKSKLAGVEASATGDQTGGEIKSLYEGESNTNAFTDSEKSKLAGLESSKFLGTYTTLGALQTAHASPAEGSYAHVDAGVGQDVAVYIWDSDDDEYQEQAASASSETASSIKTKYESNADTNAFTDSEKTKLSNIESAATADQTGSEIKALYEAEADTNAFTDAEQTKLSGIESGATADQTGSEIKTAYEGQSDTNAFTDAEKSKLSGIEASATADQTGSEIKTAYEGEANTNAFTDAEKSKLSGVESGATADQTPTEIAAGYNSEVSIVGQTEAEAGTSTTVRRWTAQRVKQAIQAIGRVLTPDEDDSGGALTGGLLSVFNQSALTNDDSRLLSLGADSTEAFGIDKNGRIVSAGITRFNFLGWFTQFKDNIIFDKACSFGSTGNMTFEFDVPNDRGEFYTNTTMNYTLRIGGKVASGSAHLQGPVEIIGNHSKTGWTGANSDGGDLRLQGGDGEDTGNGGDLIIGGGSANGTGDTGNIILANSLPSSATGLPTGALWNDSGTLKVA